MNRLLLLFLVVSYINLNAQFVCSNTINIAASDVAYISDKLPSINPAFLLSDDGVFAFSNIYSPYLLSDLNSYLFSCGYAKKNKYVISASLLSRGMENLRYYYFDLQYSQRLLSNVKMGARIYANMQVYNSRPSTQLGFMIGVDSDISKKIKILSVFQNPHTFFYKAKIEQPRLAFSLKYNAVDNMFVIMGVDLSNNFIINPNISLEYYFNSKIRALTSYNLKSFALGLIFPINKIDISFAFTYNANLGPSASNNLFLFLN